MQLTAGYLHYSQFKQLCGRRLHRGIPEVRVTKYPTKDHGGWKRWSANPQDQRSKLLLTPLANQLTLANWPKEGPSFVCSAVTPLKLFQILPSTTPHLKLPDVLDELDMPTGNWGTTQATPFGRIMWSSYPEISLSQTALQCNVQAQTRGPELSLVLFIFWKSDKNWRSHDKKKWRQFSTSLVYRDVFRYSFDWCATARVMASRLLHFIGCGIRQHVLVRRLRHLFLFSFGDFCTQTSRVAMKIVHSTLEGSVHRQGSPSERTELQTCSHRPVLYTNDMSCTHRNVSPHTESHDLGQTIYVPWKGTSVVQK